MLFRCNLNGEWWNTDNNVDDDDNDDGDNDG